MRTHRHTSSGFTLIELLVVIVVMAILLGGGWVVGSSYFAYQQGAADAERQSDVEGLARAFEQYYRENAYVAGATYPTTNQVSSSLASLVPSNLADAMKAPGQSTSSVSVASTTAAQTPTIDQYIYQPFSGSDTLCTTSTAPCVRFVFYYREEKTGLVKTVNSIRQQ